MEAEWKDNMTLEDFRSYRNPLVGTEFVYLEETGSTNDDAKALALKGALSGTVVIASTQVKGKGRSGRAWEAGKDKDIAMSIILRPAMEAERVQRLTLMAGVCVCKAVSQFCGGAGIKWPNDIIVNAKKIGGILTETSLANKGVQFAVLGIGINVNGQNFNDEIADKATSLYKECGKGFKRADIIKAVLKEIDAAYGEFLKYGESAFIDEYRNCCVNIGKEVYIVEKSGNYQATAKGISDNGELIVVNGNGEEIHIIAGEVSVRGIYGYI